MRSRASEMFTSHEMPRFAVQSPFYQFYLHDSRPDFQQTNASPRAFESAIHHEIATMSTAGNSQSGRLYFEEQRALLVQDVAAVSTTRVGIQHLVC